MKTAQRTLTGIGKRGFRSLSSEPVGASSAQSIMTGSCLDNFGRPNCKLSSTTETQGERFDVVPLLHEVTEKGRSIVGNKPVAVMDVISSGPVVIHSDYTKVRWILMGLMSNSAKFTDRGRITLIFSQDNDQVRLTIADTGRGMEQRQIDTLLETSDQVSDIEVNSLITSFLGLRIVNVFVKQLRGSISIASKIDEGTIITVSLPLSCNQ